jgi:hypothetical protein
MHLRLQAHKRLQGLLLHEGSSRRGCQLDGNKNQAEDRCKGISMGKKGEDDAEEGKLHGNTNQAEGCCKRHNASRLVEAPSPVQLQAPPVQLQAPPVQLQAPQIQLQAASIQLQAPSVQLQAPPSKDWSQGQLLAEAVIVHKICPSPQYA